MATATGQVEAALLCGGASERFGFPKEMLRVDGTPLAVRLVERLRPLFKRVTVVTNRPAYLEHLLPGCIVGDVFRERGPLAGLHAGLKNARAARCLFLACDMPLVHNEMVAALLDRATRSSAPVVIARAKGRVQPLFGVYSRSLLAALEQALEHPAGRSVHAFLKTQEVKYMDFTGAEAECLRDVDAPEGLHLLERAFQDVEPLPVKAADVRRLGAGGDQRDTVAREWQVAFWAAGVKLTTLACTPNALRELALGLAVHLGLIGPADGACQVEVDYRARRVELEVEADADRLRRAAQSLGASAYESDPHAPARPPFEVRHSHIIESIVGLRSMAPIFARTGCTHQAALSDGNAIRCFAEDIGRHNAIDKVIGEALLKGENLTGSLLMTTGRLNAQMVVKALRARVPVLASRSAATADAVRLAGQHGLTLVGFARGGRLNVYTAPERITDA